MAGPNGQKRAGSPRLGIRFLLRRVAESKSQPKGVVPGPRLRDRETEPDPGRPATQLMPTVRDREAAPWRIYLLIDPTTAPTNHALGTIFYVGNRADLPDPVDLRDATEARSLPEPEARARKHLEHLNRQGVRVLVEVIPEQQGPNTPFGQDKIIATLCAVLHPAPLNEQHRSVRWSSELGQIVEQGKTLPLPEDGAVLRLHKGARPITELPLLDEETLFQENLVAIEGRTAPRSVAKALEDSGPLPLLLVAEGRVGRAVVPGGFVLGVWLAESVEPINEDESEWRVTLHDDPETLGALRRRYLHQRVDLRDPAGIKLRKA